MITRKGRGAGVVSGGNKERRETKERKGGKLEWVGG